ncbi:MAG: hypothetical protein H6815_12760 [Phycisphaeraceae bacterium]|nr:hypothetical protein [Phycisphaerales bacterium]MCB9861313.1 hypothetical protein [Phycisphaeraceae bacterium]
MLVRFEDTKGKTHWINPVHVKVVAEVKPGRTDIFLTYGGGWGSNVTIKVNLPADQVADMLNVAMPEVVLGYVTDDGRSPLGGASSGGAAAAAAAG